MTRFFNRSIKPAFLALAVTALPFSISLAKDSKNNKQSNVSQNEALKKSKRYQKFYDGSYLEKWNQSYPKWHRKISSASPPQIPAGHCPADFSKKVSAINIKGHHVYFSVADLAFLESAGFTLKEAQLDLTIQGRHLPEQSISISLNGLKAYHPGHPRLNDSIEYLNSFGLSRTRFNLKNLVLNSSEPFDRYLLRLKKNKGLLKVSLFGRRYMIVAASINFIGVTYNPCQNPDPTPDPDPNPTPIEDLTKYEVRIDSVDPISNPTSSTNKLINFSSINADGTYWCSLDQAAFEKCKSPISYAALANGAHNFQVFATTPKGVDGAKTSYSWSIDNMKPVVTITNAGQLSTLTNSSQIAFEFSSTKAGSIFRCSLDGNTLLSCRSPISYNVATEGLHTFSVTAVDALGNTSGSPAIFRWTLDQTPPSVNLISATPIENYTSNKSKNFTFGANETSDFQCSVDQNPFTTCDSPLVLNNLSEGIHQLSIRGIDMAGNSSSSISYSWTTDYTAPIVQFAELIPATGLTNSSNFSAEFSANEIAQLYCQFDGEAAALCESPFTRANLSEGSHQLSVYAIDRAGLQSQTGAVSWTIDLTAPMIGFGAILPSSATAINSSDLNLTVHSSEILSLSATLNGNPIGISQNTILLSGLNEGHYTIEVTGVDAAGNLANTISHSFTVDLTQPVLNLISEGPDLSTLDYRSFNFEANEAATFECSIDDSGYAPCENFASYSGLADGDHNFTLRATDRAGNVSTASFSWLQDATAPRTSQSNFISGMSITINLSSTESNVTYICSLDGMPISPCESNVIYSNLAAGIHSFLARSIDVAGNIDPVGASFTFSIAPPIKTIITGGNPPGGIVTVNTMTISFTADQPAQAFICSLDNGAFINCVSAVTFNNLSEGSHQVVIKAIDEFGNVDSVGATRTWIVDTKAPIVSNFTTSITANSITVNWITNEPATGRVNFGVGTALNQNTIEVTTLTTSHSMTLMGLSADTSYSIRVIGKDAAGNTYISNILTTRTSK